MLNDGMGSSILLASLGVKQYQYPFETDLYVFVLIA